MTLPTDAELAALTGPALLALHNELAARCGKVATKRFPTRTDGVRRTAAMAKQLRELIPDRTVAATVVHNEPVNPTDVMLDEPPADAALRAVAGGGALRVVKDLKAARKQAISAGAAAQVKTQIDIQKTISARVNAKAKTSVAQRCRELCPAHDNAAVFAILQAEFGLDDGKKWYPAWYRRHEARKTNA